MLLALPVDVAARNPDPVLRAISTAREARHQFTAALEVLDGRARRMQREVLARAGHEAGRGNVVTATVLVVVFFLAPA